MIRGCVIFALLLFLHFAATSQVIHAIDLVKLAKMSHEEASKYLVAVKHFKPIPSIKIVGQTISQYSMHNNRSSELIVKSQWRDIDKSVHASIHLDVKPQSYSSVIGNELLKLGFKLISKENDNLKHISEYDTEIYTVSIYTFNDNKLPASIELHTK